MSSETPLPIQEYPDIYQYVTVYVPAGDTPYPVLYTEDEIVIDSVGFINTSASTDTEINIGYSTTAGQSDPDNLVDNFTMENARGWNDLTGQLLEQIVPGGNYIEVEVTGSATTDATGSVQIRFRTARR